MTYFRSLALGLALTLAAAPAMAQYSGGAIGGAGGSGSQAPSPQPRTPDIAPPALPGGSALAPVATGPVMQKPQIADPTAALFAAITKGDDAAAQTAVGLGADLNAQNQFGETPLDLAIALNRTGITFLLLQTRNELAAQTGGAEPMGAPWTLNSATPATVKSTPPAVPAVPPPRVSLPTDNGTPNPEAGFLGFGPKN